MKRLMIAALLLVLLAPAPARANGFTHALKKIAHATEKTLLITAAIVGAIAFCAGGGCR